MKKLFIGLLLSCISLCLFAQNYPNIINHHHNTRYTYGIKIKTNIPFSSSVPMATISVWGYHHGKGVLALNMTCYVSGFGGFANSYASSFGSATPRIWYANEGGKIVIFIDDNSEYQRFTVSAFAQGKGEQPGWFAGWTVVDEPVGEQNKLEVTYKNNFAGQVGIGTDSPAQTLDVIGGIRAHQIQVNTQKTADFVFSDDYRLPALQELESFVTTYRHLPGIASADSMIQNGINMGDFQIQLLQKIEELTLYTIEQHKEIADLKEQNKKLTEQNERLSELEHRVDSILEKMKN